MATINQAVDFDTAAIVVAEYGFEAVAEAQEEVKKEETGEVPLWRRLIADEDVSKLMARPPVVTILGHVDHGKTSLLDAVRQTDVAAGEAGGITQHIGAYQVEKKGRTITFLDTPGHAAFTAMRARGAQGADIVILVVAADDGVMPQTREAIAHAKAARVPIIVAMNKIDKPNCKPRTCEAAACRTRTRPGRLGRQHNGGPRFCQTKAGHRRPAGRHFAGGGQYRYPCQPGRQGDGYRHRSGSRQIQGTIATLLVQNGTLAAGDIVVAGKAYGRMKAITDYKGKPVQKAGPSTPVAVMGLNEVPSAGDVFQVVASEKEARAIVGRARGGR